jgi:hypothetical protein
LSSLVMIRLGRVHQSLMVDVRAINAKLQRRSKLLLRLTGRDPAPHLNKLAAALERTRGVLHTAGMTRQTASFTVKSSVAPVPRSFSAAPPKPNTRPLLKRSIDRDFKPTSAGAGAFLGN